MAEKEYTVGQTNLNQNSKGQGRMKIAEKPKDFSQAVRRIVAYCRKYIIFFIIAFILALASTLLTLFGPDRLGEITNMISAGMKTGNMDTAGIMKIGYLLTAFYVLSSVLSYLQSFVLTKTTHKIMKGMRTDIDLKLSRLPLSEFDSSSFGDVISRVTNDIDTLGQSLNNALSQMISAIFMFAICSVMMLLNNVDLSIVSIITCLAGFYGMKALISHSQKYFSNRQRYLGELNGHIEEIYAGHQVVKAFNGEEKSRKQFDKLNELLYRNNWIAQFMSGLMMPMMEFVGNLAYIAVCVYGGYLTIKGKIEFGTVIAFIAYVKLFTQPLGQLAQSMTDLQSAAAAGERVFAFMDRKEMDREAADLTKLEKCEGEVSFQHVSFGYTPDRTIIHDFTIDIPAGSNVAIVGPTGAGKTTLVNLLMRFYELNGGAICIDGVKTTDMKREDLRDLFVMVLQDSWLFEGTIKENIMFNRTDVSYEEIEKVCRSVGLHRYIKSLPQGYDTVITDDISMSAGQQQLLTIARAMVSRAPLLILDEATSSVDTHTEQVVQNAMEALSRNRTSFTIAHRLSTIRNADIILVMKDGDIVETGRHEELLERQGFYYQLWQSQFVNAEAI